MKPTKSSTNTVKVKSTSRRNLQKKSLPFIQNEDTCEPDNFQTYFPQTCIKNKARATFNILTISLSTSYLGNAEFVESSNIETRKVDIKSNQPTLADESGKLMNVVVVTSKIDKKVVISNLIFKDVKVDDGALDALYSALEYQPNVDVLKFINCSLGAQEIISIKNILTKYNNITELHIDKNPFNGDNIGILLNGPTSLKYVTLRLCQINDNCVKGIANELERVPHTLQVLNLSSNYITDLGCQYITNALRMNRTLTVLNLSNNFLTDQSCVYFRSALAKFELTPIEIKIKRQEHFNRLLLRRKLLKKYNQISVDQFDIKSQRGKSPKRRSSGGKSTSRVSDLEREKFVNANMPKQIHPFIVDVEAKDGAIFCHGNFHLAHINLAYNKITNTGLKVLHSILSYQVNHMTQIGYVGLVNLIFEGNQISFDIMYEIIGEISDFLALKNRVKSK